MYIRMNIYLALLLNQLLKQNNESKTDWGHKYKNDNNNNAYSRKSNFAE